MPGTKSQAMTVLFIVTIVIVSIGAIALVIIAAMTNNKRGKQMVEQAKEQGQEHEQGRGQGQGQGQIQEHEQGQEQGQEHEQGREQNGDAVYYEQMQQQQEQQRRLEEEYARQQQYYGGQAPAQHPPDSPGSVQYGEYWGQGQGQDQGQYGDVPGPNNPYGTGNPQQKLMQEEAARRQQQEYEMAARRREQEEMYARQQQQQQQGPGPMERHFKSKDGGDRLMNPNSPDAQSGGPRPSGGAKRKVKFLGMGGKSKAGGSYVRVKKSSKPKQHDPNSERGIMLL